MPDKRSISWRALWGLSLLCWSVKGGACLWLADPGLTPRNGHLTLNDRPVSLGMSQLPVKEVVSAGVELERAPLCKGNFIYFL